MTSLQFDSEVSRQVESVYVTPDVVEQRRVVRAVLALRPGERVLDIGVGPGLLAAEAAAEIGPDGRVCGIDVSDSMLAIAATRSEVAGSAPLELRNADANHVPYPDGSFDVVVATQVSSTSRTSLVRSPRCAGCCDRADACCCWTPTGTPSSGTRPTTGE